MILNQDMDFDLNHFLDSDSELIVELTEQLERENIHLTPELLVQILTAYEERKTLYFKEILDNLIGDQMLDSLNGPSVIQVVMEPKPKSKSKKNDEALEGVDTEYLS